ncbi:MAG: MFS transporter, partial [Ilumatobacteraceae bacterium]
PGAHPIVEPPAPDAPDAPPTSAVVGLWALFLGLGLLMIGNGLNGSVIGIRSGAEGFSLTVTGVIMAGYFVGFLLGPAAVVRLIPSVGHIRVFAGLASTASSAVLVHSVFVDPAVWTLMRFVFGFCMAGLYVVIESWLNEMATPHNRGRTLAVYMLVSMGGLAIGQLLIGVADPNGFELFVLASVLVSMSLVPMTLAATTKQPQVRLPERTTVRELLGYVPTGVISTFMNGVSAGVLIGLSAVYATAVGLSLDLTALFLAAPMVGAIIFQWPIGWISDRVSRRGVIFVVAAAAGALATALAVVPSDHPGVLVLMMLLGGATFSLYSLVVAYTLDWTPVNKTVAASGAVVRVNGTGAIVGPLLAAGLMAAFDPSMFFWTLVATNGVIVAYVGYRIVAKDALPLERQRRFVTIPARASELVYRLAPRRRHG